MSAIQLPHKIQPTDVPTRSQRTITLCFSSGSLSSTLTPANEWVRVEEGLEQAARDATVQVEADTHTQRAMWLMVCSIADAYGFDPERMQKFF